MKIAVIGHASALDHPGGAESAASNQVAVMRSFGHEVFHIACKPDLDRDFGYDDSTDTYLIRSRTHDSSYHWTDPRMSMIWRSRLQTLKPDVVHLHHYLNTGIMLPALIKQALPNCRVVLTLHEYLAICGRAGQMIDGNGALCSSSGIQKCAKCLGASPSAVMLNRNLIANGLTFVDFIVCPSQFLMKRYLAWGVKPSQLVQIPNFLDPRANPSQRNLSHTQRKKYVYLGQHTPTKGLDILLRALKEIKRSNFDSTKLMYLEIWGSGSERWPHLHSMLADLSNEISDFVTFKGPYSPEYQSRILSNASYSIVPSVWWENAPMVIQESLNAGVPIIGSDIGGIREALVGNALNVLFEPGNPFALADAIRETLLKESTPMAQVDKSSEKNSRTYSAHLSLYEPGSSLTTRTTQ